MKTKKLLSIIAAVCLCNSVLGLNHGSMAVKNAPMYAQGDNGAKLDELISGLTLDFKLVTIGNTSWAWTELMGANIQNEPYSSQLRWWQPNKVENNLTGRVEGTQQTFGKTSSLPTVNPANISLFQHTPGDWVFRESDFFSYNYTAKNSAVAGDITAPVLADPVIASQTVTQVVLSLSATDASNNVFYYIEDMANNYAEVFFTNQAVLSLNAGVNYTFSIKAIDFSGNESEAKMISIAGQVFVCNNLLDGKTFEFGTPFFAPGWMQNNNFTTNIDGSNVMIHLSDATSDMWQAQFPLLVNTPPTMVPNEKYSILMDVNVTKNTAFYCKIMDTNDNASLEFQRGTLTAGMNNLAVYDLTCPTELTKISKILFDFGWNAADVTYNISNISVCAKTTSNSHSPNANKISISQTADIITISSENTLKSVKIYSITGQLVLTKTNDNKINTTDLLDGIYVLGITDVLGNEENIKISIK